MTVLSRRIRESDSGKNTVDESGLSERNGRSVAGDFDAEIFGEITFISEFKILLERGNDFVDMGRVRTKKDSVINVNDENSRAFVEYTIVGLRFLETAFEKAFDKEFVPDFAGLFATVEVLVEF